MAVAEAERRGLANFSILSSHVLVPPAMEAILSSPGNQVQAFLAAGHVCTVMGTAEYVPIAERHHIPIVVTGFEPIDLLQGILMAVRQLEEGRYAVENQYARSVRPEGNLPAQGIIRTVFRVSDRKWRGIGSIPQSGYRLAPAFERFDAERRFSVGTIHAEESPLCMAGEVLQGLRRPDQCPAFGKECTPERPLGAPMVSSEGACAAYHQYSRFAGPGH
jgi:hydrogenase expression/formation protein HypD